MINRIKHFAIVINLIILNNLLFAQKVAYNPIECSGIIPQDFYKFQISDISKNSANPSKSFKKVENEFALRSKLGLNTFLQSGLILFGDPLTEYINKVADKALIGDLELRNQLRFYVFKSNIVNAFATSEGIIFVSIGLLSQVENEAQLAFILCHEAIHVKNQHSLNYYKKVKNEANTANSLESLLDKLYKYSRKNELEADKMGMKLFLKSEYRVNESIRSLDVLLYSYLPFDEVEWNKKEFEDENYLLSKELHLEKLKEISVNAFENDEKSTHPNINTRKVALKDFVNYEEEEKGVYFINSKETFDSMQKLARYELAYILITRANFVKAYYHAYLLEKTYGKTLYFDQIKLMSIYGIAKHRYDRYNKLYVQEITKNFEGEFQRMVYFFREIKRFDLSVLAVREAYKYQKIYANNSFINNLYDKLLESLFVDGNATLDQFDNQEKFSKMDSTKLSTLKDDFSRFAFLKMFEDEKFKKMFRQKMRFKKTASNTTGNLDENEEDLGIKSHIKSPIQEKIILFSPEVIVLKGNENSSYKDIFSEPKEAKMLSENMVEVAKSVNVNLEFLETTDTNQLSLLRWNNTMKLKTWMLERLCNDTTIMELINHDGVLPLQNYFGAKKVGIIGVYKEELKKEIDDWKLLTSCALFGFPAVFYVVYTKFHKVKRNVIYISIFDIQSNKYSFSSYVEYKGKNDKYKQQSKCFQLLLNLKFQIKE